jgi:hypothetical protein
MRELARDTGWFKSSFSSADSDNCVEVRMTEAGVGVRDSKAVDAQLWIVSATAWADLIKYVTVERV